MGGRASGGSTGGGNTGIGGTTGSVSASNLPCDVLALFQNRCMGCHASPPVNSAPMPLMTRDNLMALSTLDRTQTYAQRALVRIQAAVGQMPPAPAARATAAEIQALGTWISAGYPTATCAVGGLGGAPGGVGGSMGTGGRIAGTGGSTGTSAGGLPCDVQAVYQAHCTTCHATTPVGGAPMALVTRADLMAQSTFSAAQTNAERTVARMQSTTSPMPPAPGTRATTAEITTVNSWIAAGYPAGNCGAGGAGGTTGTTDPLNTPPRCTSGSTWTGGNEGDPAMNPGRACIACHRADEGPTFAIAGTLYPTGHEPDLCNGVNGTTGARVVIVDAMNRTLTLTPNAAGNFTSTGPVTPPYTAKVTYQGRERIMPAAQTSGDCNSCHTQNGTMGAPGRITLP